MTVTYRVKISQTEEELCKGASNAWYVDNSYTTGIGLAKFISIKADGVSNAPSFVGSVIPTWQLADASDKLPARGLVYSTSARKVDTTVTDRLTSTDANWYPYGDRETKAIIPIRQAEIVCEDSTRDYFFNTTKKVLTGTVEVAVGTKTKIDGTNTLFTTELRVGDWVIVGGEERQISVVDSATQVTVSVAFTNAVAATATGYISSDLFKNIYLAEDGGFTKLIPTSNLKQILGYVINGNNVKIDLSYDKDGTVL